MAFKHLALFVCIALAATAVYAQDRVYAKQHKATLNEGRKTIDAQFGGHEDANPDSARMAVLRDSVNLMLKEHQQRLRAQASGNTAVAGHQDQQVAANKLGDDAVEATGVDGQKVAAKKTGDTAVQAVGNKGEKVSAGSKGDSALAMQGRNRAKANLVRQGKVVRGGTAQQGAHNAQMTNELRDGQKVSHLNADGRYHADAAAASRTQYNVKTADNQDKSSRGAYAVDSQSLSQQDGAGRVNAKNSKGQAAYNYAFSQAGSEGQASLDQIGAGTGVFNRRTTGWKCTAVKDGESTCLDANGQIVGKVFTNAQGEATVVDDNGVVIGRGKAQKVSDEKYEVIVSDGLATATTEQLKQYDCYNEIVPGGAQEHKIAIENVEVLVDGVPVDAAGGQTFSWPTCFDIQADVTIPAGVDPSRLAFEYLGHVMPMGTMKCMDSMTCGRGCYYCNACDKERLLNPAARLTTGTETNPVCDIHDGAGKQAVSMRVCPPADMEKYAFCGGFDRHIVGNDYYSYDGSINAQIRVWLRPENEMTLRNAFFNAINAPITGSAWKTALVADYRVKNAAAGSLTMPSDNELLEFYVRREGEEKLMACRRGIVDYNVGGSDVNSNLMIDAFTNLPGKNVQLFSDAPCDSWMAQQQKEYDAYLKEHQESSTGSTSGSLLGLIRSRMLSGNGIRRHRL